MISSKVLQKQMLKLLTIYQPKLVENKLIMKQNEEKIYFNRKPSVRVVQDDGDGFLLIYRENHK